MEDNSEPRYKWESCCFLLDQRCIVFTVQTLIGMALIIFCAYMLSTETNCDRSAPYWGLIGTIAGFFFNRLSVTHYGVDVNQNGDHTPMHIQQPRLRHGVVHIHEHQNDLV